jgi:tetratricopeptide (TPR) repeat protein
VDQEAFSILGRTRVRIAGRFETKTSKHWQILAALLAQPGRQLTATTLLNWVWADDEDQPENARRTFDTYRSRIRTLLGKMDVDAELVFRNGTMRLRVDRLLIDYHRFRAQIEQAWRVTDAGDLRRARELVLRATELWHGPPLEDLHSVEAERWRRRAIESLWVPANDLLIDLHLRLGDADRALAKLDELEEDHQPNVRQIKQRLKALRGLGRPEEFNGHYLRFRGRFRAAGDMEAADDLKRLHDEISGMPAAETTGTSVAPVQPAILSLPHVAPGFVGRDPLLTQLDAVATSVDGDVQARVVCLEGQPGIGKTALATRWARRRHETFGDSAILMDLRGFGTDPALDADAAVDELLDLLGFPVARVDTVEGRARKLRELLSERRVVVVLDNVRDSAHVLPLLRLLSNSLVLITTRRHLTKLALQHGASVIAVRPLSDDDAVRLLTERIGLRAEYDMQSVARLASRCGGLPLALTLVVQHIVLRHEAPLRDFVDGFADPSALLALGDDGDDAGSSLAMAFATSYRALAEREQRVFRLLGLFPGPDIELAAAAALTALEAADCRRSLDNLASFHLVEPTGSLGRWRLHDLLRAYAADLNGADGDRVALRRLLDFYLHTAYNADRQIFAHKASVPMLPLPNDVSPLRFTDARGGAEWTLRERANLSAVFRLAAQQGFLEYSWRFPHLVGVLRRYGWRSTMSEALELAAEAAKRLGDAQAEGAARNDIGYLALEAGDFAAARRHFHYAAALAERAGEHQAVARSLFNLARIEVIDGSIESGIERCQTVLAMAVECGDLHTHAVVERFLADVYRDRREYDRAATYYHSSLRSCEAIGYREGHVQALIGISGSLLQRGRRDDFSLAEEYARRAIELLPDVADFVLEQGARCALAEVLLASAKIDDAVAQAAIAVRLAGQTRAALPEAVALDLQARALLRSGRLAAAAAAWTRCAVIHRDRGDGPAIALVESRLQDLACAIGDVPAARDPSVAKNFQGTDETRR